jgi:hypothetical protein
MRQFAILKGLINTDTASLGASLHHAQFAYCASIDDRVPLCDATAVKYHGHFEL